MTALDVKSHSLPEGDDRTGYIDMKEIGDWYVGVENEEGRRVGVKDG